MASAFWRNRSWLGLCAALFLVGSPFSTATPSSSAAPENTPPAVGDWVVQRMDSDVESLNPILGTDANGSYLRENLICEGMLRRDNITLKLEPNLAESWDISPDHLVFTFHLRHGVTWHDGKPFTAEDVKFTFDRVLDPKVDAAPLRGYFENLKTCEVVDPYTVRFVTGTPYFKSLEEIGGLAIVPKHFFAPDGSDFNTNDFSRHPIGTGPYRFIRWQTGAQIVLERNDAYWRGTVVYPKRIVYQIIEEPFIAAQLTKKGEIDVFEKVTPIQWEHQFKGSAAMQHLRQLVYPYPAYNYFGFNLRLPIFRDVRVRHAIDLLVPRDEILAQVYLGQYGAKTAGYDLPAGPSYDQSLTTTPYDPVEAKRLLTEAGWKDDHGDGRLYLNGKPFSFTLLYPSGDPKYAKIAELTQESFRKAGIDLQLERLAFIQLIQRVDDWKFDMCALGWALDINSDPYQIWHGSQATVKKSSNYIGYQNAQVDKLIEQARLEYDDDRRNALYRQVHRLIHDDYPVCFLFNPKIITVVDDRFQGVTTFAPRPCYDATSWWVAPGHWRYQE